MGRAFLLPLLLLAAASVAAAQPAMRAQADDDQCETCKQLVAKTKEQLAAHAGDAKEYLESLCESSPEVLKDTCVKVAKSTGDTIKDLLNKAYDSLDADTLCSFACTAEPSAAAQAAAAAAARAQEAVRAFAAGVQQELLGVWRAVAASMVGGPFDVLCSTCKSSLESAKEWIKAHQTDVREFMYAQCDSMAGVDPAECKETADKVADQVEAALQAVYDSMDETTVCAAFCPPPAPPAAALLGSVRDELARRFAAQQQ